MVLIDIDIYTITETQSPNISQQINNEQMTNVRIVEPVGGDENEIEIFSEAINVMIAK